jgi:hypothetical protein
MAASRDRLSGAGGGRYRDVASQYGATADSPVVLAPMRAAIVLPLRAAGTCVPAAARPKADPTDVAESRAA